ncbi:MAG TPA: hypothetical protein VGH85_08825 [Mycobacteriales bacterium]
MTSFVANDPHCSTWPVWDPDGEQCGSLVFVIDGDRTEITRADPRLTVNDLVVLAFEVGRYGRVVFDRWCLGALVHFCADNRTVTYRIVDRELARGLWLLEWPD